MTPEERRCDEAILIANIASRINDLKCLLDEVNHKWVYDDLVYRFYYQSYKVYGLQESTLAIVEQFKSLAPRLPLNGWFMRIVSQGTGKQFQMEDNQEWLEVTRPIVEAFFHARYFLEMICKYGTQFEEPPTVMPGGWAAVLCLFNLR